MFTDSSRPIRHSLDFIPAHIRITQEKDFKFPLRIGTKKNQYHTGSIFSFIGNRNQRCIVKISYTKNSKIRSWAAHGEYLQREHAQNIGEKGFGFNEKSNSVDLKTTLRQWQNENDEHVFKLIISPENGHQLDLKQHATDLMKQVEKDLKTKLEWAAIDHHNTDHPHLHVLIRGVNSRGNTLTIEPHYLTSGLRHRSEELATRVLGLRLENDMVQSRSRQIEREYFTEIDRSLRHKAVNSIVNFHTPVSNNLVARELRLFEIKRLKFLENLSLAKKISAKAWKLDDEFELKLKNMQLSNDIIKSRARHNIDTISYEVPTPTHIQKHKPLTGKVVGMGLEDELRDKRYLLIEGIDGKIHYIQATNSIIKARDNFEFKNENVITLEKKKFLNEQGKTIEYIKLENHLTLENLLQKPVSRLDKDVLDFVKENGIIPTQNFPKLSFSHEYAKAIEKRFHELEKARVITHEQGKYHLDHNWERRLSHIIKMREQKLKLEMQHQQTLDHKRGPNHSHKHHRKR
jgi:type IV secretory pathway VirD2 relaxase